MPGEGKSLVHTWSVAEKTTVMPQCLLLLGGNKCSTDKTSFAS